VPRKIIATVDSAKNCPIFKVGDKMSFALPEILTGESDALCGIAIADLLPWVIKLTAGGEGKDELLLCRGCRGGKASAGFIIERVGEIARDPKLTQKLSSLRTIPLFSSLPDRQLEKITPFLHEVEFTPGDEVMTAGEVGTALYVVMDGHVEVIKPSEEGTGQETVLATLAYGECFGEMSLLTGDPVTATIRAKSSVRALEIRKDDFDGLLSRNPVLNSYFSKLLALRLKKTSKQFLEEFEKGVTGNLQMLAAPELIQAITVTDRTGTLKVKDGKKWIDLYFKAGQIHNVETNIERETEEAVYEFLAWRSGSFRFEPGERSGKRGFFKDTTGLLLEGMRRIDDAKMKPEALSTSEEPPLEESADTV
jgi:uncharacterized repeat protein (TIGR04076 family)